MTVTIHPSRDRPGLGVDETLSPDGGDVDWPSPGGQRRLDGPYRLDGAARWRRANPAIHRATGLLGVGEGPATLTRPDGTTEPTPAGVWAIYQT